MFFRALLSFLLLPGVLAFALPLLIAAFDPWRSAVWWQGAPLMLIGLVLLLWCVRDFYIAGKGTIAPWDPPKHLVLIGLYRHVRNPMYIAVLALVSGWSVCLASPLLALYVIVLSITFHIRVTVSEEPLLSSRFGDEWTQYCDNVDRWFPRIMPWRRGL
jgi:protein-S-isoprenylcysteine O-methyltransferase Ste14